MLAVSFAVFLWLIELAKNLFNLDLEVYGVLPRHMVGLSGILWAPLIHGSLSHLFANTMPIVLLTTALLYGYPRSARIVLPIIYLGTGLCVWLFARSAYHFGASSLTFGMMFFVFVVGALRWDSRAIVISMVVFFLYGGMIWGVFPSDPRVSFESHFFSAVIGVVLAFLLKNYDAAPPMKKYSWEGEVDEPSGDDEWNSRE